MRQQSNSQERFRRSNADRRVNLDETRRPSEVMIDAGRRSSKRFD